MAGEGVRSVRNLFRDLPANVHQELRNAISRTLQQFTYSAGFRIERNNRSQFHDFQETRLPQGAISLERYVQELLRRVVPHCRNMNSARCLGHMTGGVPPFVRLLGDVVLGLNQNMVKEEASGSFSGLERQTLAILHRLIYGLDEGFYEEHTQQPPVRSELWRLTGRSRISQRSGLRETARWHRVMAAAVLNQTAYWGRWSTTGSKAQR